MADSVTVTSHHSYGSRVGNSLKAILGGFLLVIISIRLLAWNENRYAKTEAGLKEGNKDVQETISTQINPDLEGKEVHLYGEIASTSEALQDSTFGIITDDLKLKRTVEMYQRHEDSKEECHDNLGGSEDCETTYTYDKKWDDEAIDSNNFQKSEGHENPTNREFNSTEQEKSPITLGVYTLTTVFTDQLKDYKTINLNEQNIKIPEKYQKNPDSTTQEVTTENAIENNNDNYLYGNEEDKNNTEETTATNTRISSEEFHIYDNYIYIGKDPNEPTIGDLKITFSSVKTGTVSVIGKQVGNELTTHTTSNGTPISLLEQGNVTANDMFLHAQQANKNITRILRLFGLLLMYLGFVAMFQFIETLAKVIPFLSRIIGVGTGIIALGLTIVVGFITIGIARLAVRPIIGISCLVVAVGGLFLLKKSKNNKSESNENIAETNTTNTNNTPA